MLRRGMEWKSDNFIWNSIFQTEMCSKRKERFPFEIKKKEKKYWDTTSGMKICLALKKMFLLTPMLI